MISSRIRGQFKRNIISPLQPETAESETHQQQRASPVSQSGSLSKGRRRRWSSVVVGLRSECNAIS